MNIPKNVIVLDTETGGLDPLVHSILSAGLVSADGTQKMEIFIKEPIISSNPRSMAVNGLDLDEIRTKGLEPDAACQALDEFVEKVSGGERVMTVGHNIAFDIAFLRRLYGLADRELPQYFSHRTVDTHTLMWALVAQGKLPPHIKGSDSAFAHFGVSPPPETRHTALADAEATRLLLGELLALVG